MNFEYLSKIAKLINEFRLLPRLFIGTYLILFYQTVIWFMALSDPSLEQAGLISVMTATGSVWFGYYVNTNTDST